MPIVWRGIPVNVQRYQMKENQFLKQTIDEAVDAKSKEDGEPGGTISLPRQVHSAHLAILGTAIVLS